MKRIATVLTLLALFALVPYAQAQLATTPTAPANVADFLATLSGGQSDAPDLGVVAPAPNFLSTTCTSHADCPAGQLCCYPCGIDGCDFICMQTERNRCPFFP